METGALQTKTPGADQAPADSLLHFSRLVGTWQISGEAEGRTTFEWADGRRFLLQYVDIAYGGRQIKGLEVIGYLHPLGAKPTTDVCSRFYSFLDGLTLDYVYEIDGDRLTIWFGPKHSDNRFLGRFSADGKRYSGAWQWPGGGYSITARRIGPS